MTDKIYFPRSLTFLGYGGANAHVIIDDAYHFLQTYNAVENERYLIANTSGAASDDGSEYSIVPAPADHLVDALDNLDESQKLFIFSSADQAGLQRLATTYAS